jgi:hypothetical protein
MNRDEFQMNRDELQTNVDGFQISADDLQIKCLGDSQPATNSCQLVPFVSPQFYHRGH